MKLNRILLLPLLAALLGGCFKDTSIRTEYVLKPLVETLSGNLKEPLTGVLSYAFAADTTLWTAASYDDAAAGKICLKADPAQTQDTPLATAEAYEMEGTTGWLSMPLSRASQMVVVVDTQNRLYAYTQQSLEVNLPKLYVSVLFQPWKEGNSYTSGNWSFYNEFYTPPVLLTCNIIPTAQTAEDATPEAIADVRVYAFAADTLLWQITSYQNANAGIITSKTDPQTVRETPNFTAYKQSGTNVYAMSVSATPLMVVVVDRTHGLYAYSKQAVTLGGDPVDMPVVLRTWTGLWKQDEAGWIVVDEAQAPADDSQTTTP